MAATIPEVYCDDVKFGTDIFTGVTNVQKLAAEYRDGASIVMPALNRTWMPLKELCAKIERQIDHVVHANAYLTPGNAAGFLAHYDTHEVLVLQIAGKKHWRIYASPLVVAVEFKQRRLILSAETHEALEGMRQQRTFRTAELPGPLSLDAKLTLVRTLFEKGSFPHPPDEGYVFIEYSSVLHDCLIKKRIASPRQFDGLPQAHPTGEQHSQSPQICGHKHSPRKARAGA